MPTSQSSYFSPLKNFEPITFIFLKYLSGLCNLRANKLKQKAIFKVNFIFGAGLETVLCSHTSYRL